MFSFHSYKQLIVYTWAKGYIPGILFRGLELVGEICSDTKNMFNHGPQTHGGSECRGITWIIENVADLDLNRFE